MTDVLTTLRRRIARAPQEPGVYRWKNTAGDILYVGKAKNLRNRLRSYVQQDGTRGKGVKHRGIHAARGPWKEAFYKQIADFDVTVTNTELEALVLETNLIKEIRPKYNVLMKDDKHYVYVEVTVNDPYPRIDTERKMLNPDAKYFGPFLSAWETRQTLDMLNEIFNFRACKESIRYLNSHPPPPPGEGSGVGEEERTKLRPCLDYQIGRCCGTCAGVISKEEYRSRIDQVLHFFKGDYKPVLEKGRELMKAAAAEKKFERAASLRDKLSIIESLQERQLVSDTSGENADVIGVAVLSGKAHAVLMRKRNGKLIDEEQFALMGAAESISDVLDQLLPQYYDAAADIPDTVIVGEAFPDIDVFADFLSSVKGKKVKVIVPERGKKSQLLQLAEKNAHEKARQAEASWEAESRNIESALSELTSLLELPAEPHRIEGYDISHTGGTETVGSMVVMIEGKPRNDQYRNFTIHSMQKGAVDDYRALKEVLARRLRHLTNAYEKEKAEWEKQGITIGKAKKADHEALEAIVTDTLHEQWPGVLEAKEWTVARADGRIVGCARLMGTPGASELTSIWVDPAFGDGQLSAFLIRSVLHNRTKGKVYTLIDPIYEQNYGIIGFRYVIKPPAFLQDRVSENRICIMYDPVQHKTDSSLASKPDLLVIDGGKGQLNAIVDVLQSLELTIPVIGLAKREEEIFVPGKPVSLLVPQDSPAKFLLMRLRDEAHRFANRHRQKRAARSAIKSQLDSVPGIGPELKAELLRRFGSVDSIKRAPDEELEGILSRGQIEAIRNVL